MTLSGALSNAITGLTASSRSAEVVSNNVANALTEGYATRQIQLSSRGYGGGVHIEGVQRNWDPVLLGDRRVAQANLSQSATQHDALSRIESHIGLPSDPGSLSARLAAFDTALIEANSRPESEARQGNVVRTAKDLVATFNQVTDAIQQERMVADRAIATSIDQLNTGLKQVEELNAEILRFTMTGNDVNGLIDQRQMVIDGLADIVPIKQIEREFGRVALYTELGAMLIDGPAPAFEYEPTGLIIADMTLGSGALSGLSVNDNDIRTSGTNSPIAGGRLAALFEIRDELAPAAQEGLDSLARNLAERFQDPAVDATLGAGDAGLFTDQGAVFDPVDETGLAGRLTLNSAVDPTLGGELWRIRDGINALVQGDVGNSTLFTAMSEALSANITPSSGPFSSSSHTSESLFSTFLSTHSAARMSAEGERVFDTTRFESLKSQELKEGVDTDDQMQKLLLVERAYSANARVVSTIDELLDELLRI